MVLASIVSGARVGHEEVTHRGQGDARGRRIIVVKSAFDYDPSGIYREGRSRWFSGYWLSRVWFSKV